MRDARFIAVRFALRRVLLATWGVVLCEDSHPDERRSTASRATGERVLHE